MEDAAQAEVVAHGGEEQQYVWEVRTVVGHSCESAGGPLHTWRTVKDSEPDDAQN